MAVILKFSIIKIALINILITVAILISFETTAFVARLLFGKESVGWMYVSGIKRDLSSKDCLKMRTHPFYGHEHDYDSCTVPGGRIIGPFVAYGNSSYKDAILVLGGSTTDGFYQQFSHGNGWPYYLNGLLESAGKKLQIINGGVGGYGSSQELLKLLIDAPRLNINIKYVISLNGINDTKGYGGLPAWLEGRAPFWTWVHYTMYSSERYVKQNADSRSSYFPSLMSLIRYISEKISTPTLDKVQDLFYLEGQKEISAGQQWYRNIRIMHEVSKELGAQYYVFLQPTMGLKGQIPDDILSSDYLIYKQMSTEYLLEINRHYQELRKFCAKVNFCVDIAAVAPPAGNFYADPRHHNEAGNKLIADKIYEYIYPSKSK